MYQQTLAWPFRITALFAVLSFVVVSFAFTNFAQMNFWIGVLVITLGSPVWYAVLGSLSLYARKLLTQAAQGLFDEPIDSETEINPFLDSRAVLLGVAHLIAFVLFYYNGPEVGWLLVGPAFLFTLMWTGIMLDDSIFRYFNPNRATQILSGLGLYYPIAMLLIAGSVGYLHYSLLYENGILNLVLSPFAFLFGNLLFGLMLYHRRQELDLHTMKSPEQSLAEELAAEQRQIDQLFHDVHTHVNAGSYAHAIKLLEAHVAEDPVTLDPFMHERLKVYQNDRLYLEHAVRYLGRLVARGEKRKAWALLKICLEKEEKFRPPEAEVLLDLTKVAGLEDAGMVNLLLSDFAEAYPESSLIADAQFRRARVCIELLRDGETGTRLLAEIARNHPEFARGDAFQRYRNRLKPTG